MLSWSKLILLVVTGLPIVCTAALAATMDELIAAVTALNQTERSWHDRSVRLTLATQIGIGPEEVRELELHQKRYPGSVQKSVTIFRSPGPFKDLAILEYRLSGLVTDQWLYQPSLRRTRRMRAAGDESVLGGDLTTHDFELLATLPARAFPDDAIVLRGDGHMDGVEAFVVEYTTNHDASYRKAVLWLGKKDSVVRRLELYDENERLTKQITATDIRVVGRIPVVFRIEGETMGSSSRTVIQLKNVAFDQGIDDNLFTEGALVRGGK